MIEVESLSGITTVQGARAESRWRQGKSAGPAVPEGHGKATVHRFQIADIADTADMDPPTTDSKANSARVVPGANFPGTLV
jgi:hypothetical protein